MITKLDKQSLNVIRKSFDEALKKASENLGVDVNLGSISYRPDLGSFRISLKGELKQSGDGKSSAQLEWEQYYSLFSGLKCEWLGREFKHDERLFKIVGLKRNARKSPVRLSSNGKLFKASVDWVRMHFMDEKSQ